MRQKILLSFILFLLVFGLTGLQAQESTNASGGNASGSGGTVSYSVGQTVYKTNSGSNGSAAEGVQQPYEISIITDIGDNSSISLICNVFPNPAKDFLTLTVDNSDKETLLFQIYDETGKILKSEKISESETKIDLANYDRSIYFLRILNKNQEIKLFKIVKN